ncbi:CapA family protein [Staphylococcus sp. SQ8-PEA]|uniref:CapA family protein n=1 Tax=Staphylococcus marylandisciuri TaxID=2981529 RepID=A0ABT2QN91_9STAP|nr:CapA family protein [Staphylococcus marylandisciuri]
MIRKLIRVVVPCLLLLTACNVSQSPAHQTVSVEAVGDNLIHPSIYNEARQSDGSFDFKSMYKPLKKRMSHSDIAFINQESPIGGDDKPYHGFKRFNTPSAVADDIVDTGFNMINGSNNHALDQGMSGLKNELSIWDHFKDKVTYTGTYRSQKERDHIKVKNVKGVKVALISYTYGTNGLKPAHNYNINRFDKDQIKADIQKAKKLSDVVMVSTHWGKEGTHKTTPMQKEYAQYIANQGADVIIGTHPHVIQPVQWLKGQSGHKTLVAYSLGNFLNGQATGDENNVLGGDLHFDIAKDGNKTKIKHVHWQAVVTHYEPKNPQTGEGKAHFKELPLEKYNDKLAQRHKLNYKQGSTVSVARLKQINEDTISPEFRK